MGPGFPGLAHRVLRDGESTSGDTIDIHTGGEDNIFPHHECEIAQSEAATGKPFARYWMHARHLLVDGGKMAKSMGNFYTLADLMAKGHEPMAVRLALLSVQYRQPMNLTTELFTEAAKNLARVREMLSKLGRIRACPTARRSRRRRRRRGRSSTPPSMTT